MQTASVAAAKAHRCHRCSPVKSTGTDENTGCQAPFSTRPAVSGWPAAMLAGDFVLARFEGDDRSADNCEVHGFAGLRQQSPLPRQPFVPHHAVRHVHRQVTSSESA